MEERFLFTQIHEALDIPTPPGAYERLRMELTKKPVRPFRWPALQTRWSKMSFRFAAGLAIIAIAVAAAAAAVAIHNATNNTSPAAPRMSIQAYQTLIASAPDPNRVWTDPCDESTHTGCASDAARSIPLIQRWLNDLNAASVPSRFVTLDAELRQHLAQNLTALKSLQVDSASQDQAAMTRDYIVAVYAVDWMNTVVPDIAASQQVGAGEYTGSVRGLEQIDSCVTGCTLLASTDARTCVSNGGVPCLQMFDEVAVRYADFAGRLVLYAAPDSLSAKDARLQTDVAAADAVLLTMRTAVAGKDQVGINSGIDQLLRLKTRIDLDATAITG